MLFLYISRTASDGHRIWTGLLILSTRWVPLYYISWKNPVSLTLKVLYILSLLMKYSPLDGSCLYSLLQIWSCEQGQARNVSFPRIGIHSMNKTIFFVDLFKNWSGSWSPWNPPPSIQAHDCPTQRMDRHWQGWLFDSENACDENQRKQNSSIQKDSSLICLDWLFVKSRSVLYLQSIEYYGYSLLVLCDLR